MSTYQSEYWDIGPSGTRRAPASGVQKGLRTSSLLIRTFVLGLPVWWALGMDWLASPVFALCLILCSLETYTRFRATDYLVFAMMLGLAISAYINGLIGAQEPTRFLAAYYNLTVFIASFVLMLAVRRQLEVDPDALSLLKAGTISFVGLFVVVWICVVFAFATRQFTIEFPSVFGLVVGHHVPDSAPLIRDSTVLTFSRPDWGLSGFPTPRIALYGPYPTAAAATVAVLGTMTLLYVQRRGRARDILIPLLELMILMTIATTLTRSILGGWLIGAVTANLVFGTAIRRILAAGVILLGIVLAPNIQHASHAVEYRSYSTESRFENYFYAAEQTFRKNAAFGLGIKPREEENHIAVGSHSTFVSFFTKGGALVLSIAVIYFLLIPMFRWFVVIKSGVPPRGTTRAELRILLNLQIAIWIWLFFEDIDAPANASALIFLSFAFIEQGLLGRTPRARSAQVSAPGARSRYFENAHDNS